MVRRGRQPWKRVKGRWISLYLSLAKRFCPEIISKPGDLWPFKEVLFRVAILKDRKYVERIRITYHYIWDAPSKEEIKKRHPEWSHLLVEARHRDFQNHIRFYGPGDVELVVVDLLRVPSPGSVDLKGLHPADFRPVVINYRNGAHRSGVFKQFRRFEWDKLGKRRITVAISEREWKRMGQKLTLVIDSYHHSFSSPEELNDPKVLAKIFYWPNPIKPRLRHFSDRLWEYYRVVPKNRGYEPWEAE